MRKAFEPCNIEWALIRTSVRGPGLAFFAAWAICGWWALNRGGETHMLIILIHLYSYKVKLTQIYIFTHFYAIFKTVLQSQFQMWIDNSLYANILRHKMSWCVSYMNNISSSFYFFFVVSSFWAHWYSYSFFNRFMVYIVYMVDSSSLKSLCTGKLRKTPGLQSRRKALSNREFIGSRGVVPRRWPLPCDSVRGCFQGNICG